MNKKGFVLAETLVVVIFSVVIFTLLYSSAVPLLAKYEDLSFYDDIDTTYDLYQYKKLLENDSNYNNIISHNNYKKLECSDFNSIDRCNTLNSVLNFKDTDTLLYFEGGSVSGVKSDSSVDSDVREYLDYLELDETKKYLLIEHDNYLSYIELYVSS